MKFFTKEAAKIQEADRDRPQKDKSPPSSADRESPEMHISQILKKIFVEEGIIK